MIQKTVPLLLLLGLPSVISSSFLLIGEQKNWTDAQSYCREYHVDLATVQTDEDRREIQSTVSGAVKAWMGLYGGVCQWRWSYQDQDLKFSFWDLYEDVSSNTQRMCVVIRNTGHWNAMACDQPKPFFCYNGDPMGKFTFIAIKKSWRDAQIYCRTNFIDLATISDLPENTAVLHYIVSLYKEYEAWIGLRKNLWLWSDQSKVTWLSLTWTPGDPDNGDGQEQCAFVDEHGLIGDEQCDLHLPFFCLKRVKVQVLRVAVKSSGLLDESAMTMAIQKKIKMVFSELEMDPGFRITWRVQPDGKIFQPLQSNVENSTTACEQDRFYDRPFHKSS